MPDPGPLPTIHPRHEVVERARRELAELEWEWSKRHGLTVSEKVMLLSELQTSWLRSCVECERRRMDEEE